MSEKAKTAKAVELRDVPTVVATEEGFRFATQIVDELPGGVDICVQIRKGSPVDLVDHMHMMRHAAWQGYFTSSPEVFERKYPAGRSDLNRMRIPVRAYVEIGESPEEEILRGVEERRRAEEEKQRRQIKQEQEEQAKQKQAAMRTIAGPVIRPLERERDELRRQLEEERAARAEAEAKLASSTTEGGSAAEATGEAPNAGDGQTSADTMRVSAAHADAGGAEEASADGSSAARRSRTRHRDEDPQSAA